MSDLSQKQIAKKILYIYSLFTDSQAFCKDYDDEKNISSLEYTYNKLIEATAQLNVLVNMR